jgi:hypothetical protein
MRLKDDAAASVRTNYAIYETAAHFVEVHDQQMATGMGITSSVWQSSLVIEMRGKRFRLKERDLLS